MNPMNSLNPHSRRTFLSSMTATAAATLPAGRRSPRPTGRQTPASAPRVPFKVGVVTYNIAKDWDLATILKNLPEAGIEGVELRTTHAHGVELSLTPDARRDVRRKFADSPLAPRQPRHDLRVSRGRPGGPRPAGRGNQTVDPARRGRRSRKRQSATEWLPERCSARQDARADRPCAGGVQQDGSGSRHPHSAGSARAGDRARPEHPSHPAACRRAARAVRLLELESDRSRGWRVSRPTSNWCSTGSARCTCETSMRRNTPGDSSLHCSRGSTSVAIATRNLASRRATACGC